MWAPVCIHRWSCPFIHIIGWLCLHVALLWVMAVIHNTGCIVWFSWAGWFQWGREFVGIPVWVLLHPQPASGLWKRCHQTSPATQVRVTALNLLWLNSGQPCHCHYCNQIFLSAHYIAVRNLPQWRSLVDFTYGFMNIHEHSHVLSQCSLLSTYSVELCWEQEAHCTPRLCHTDKSVDSQRRQFKQFTQAFCAHIPLLHCLVMWIWSICLHFLPFILPFFGLGTVDLTQHSLNSIIWTRHERWNSTEWNCTMQG